MSFLEKRGAAMFSTNVFLDIIGKAVHHMGALKLKCENKNKTFQSKTGLFRMTDARAKKNNKGLQCLFLANED